MELERKGVMTILPAGPDNPLGRYAIETSVPGILIHETIKPSSVYQFISHLHSPSGRNHRKVLSES